MIQSRKQKAAVSPCINVCTLDNTNGLCQGCFRSLDEISFWSRASNDQRLKILDAVARRHKEFSQ